MEKEPEEVPNDQSSNEENSTKDSETRTLKKARLGCDVCYLSKSETGKGISKDSLVFLIFQKTRVSLSISFVRYSTVVWTRKLN